MKENMKKKTQIATVTYHRVHNCGAMLQAYALQRTLIKLGYDNFLINDCRKNLIFKRINLIKLNDKRSKNKILNLLRNIKRLLIFLKDNFAILIKYESWKTSWKRFEGFNNNYLIKTEYFDSYEELRRNPPEADIYLVGSDQMWKIYAGISENQYEYHMMNFIKNSAKCRTYAVSMGDYYDLESDKLAKFKNDIKKFPRISGREKDMMDFFDSIDYAGETYTHIDPVFLLEEGEWESLAEDADERVKKFSERKYMFVFELLESAELTKCVNQYKGEYEVILCTRCPVTKIKADVVIRDIGPLEFLWLIKNAKLVLTTSFHASVFSIVFEKTFKAFLSSNAPGRIVNLLKCMDLEDCLWDNNRELSTTVDFSNAKSYIEKSRTVSLDYLKRLEED